MSPATRAWMAFPAIGAGIIHLALALATPGLFAAVLGILGAVEFFWGVLTFAQEHVPLARAASIAALLPTIAWAVSAAAGLAPPLSLVAMAGASLLELTVAVVLARHLRRGDAPPASRTIVGVVSALVVVTLVTGASIAAAPHQVGLPSAPPLHGH